MARKVKKNADLATLADQAYVAIEEMIVDRRLEPGQMISEGVSLGAIQIPAGGRPIILFVEQQTTGGYPKIANIISADLASVGQLRPRDEIRFEQVTPETARALIREQEEWLRSGVLFS